MKLIIDTDVCKNKGSDADVIIYLLSLLSSCPITADTFEKARQKGFLKFHKPYDRMQVFPDYVEASDTGKYVAESMMANSNNTNEDRFTALANKLRAIFPAGKKSGYAYTWRDSESCIADRLKKFFLKYGNYSDDEIVNATKRYVDSFNGNYTYMQLLKYFIWKNKVAVEEVVNGRVVGEVEKQSQLAAWLDDKEEENSCNDDWTVELR